MHADPDGLSAAPGSFPMGVSTAIKQGSRDLLSSLESGDGGYAAPGAASILRRSLFPPPPGISPPISQFLYSYPNCAAPERTAWRWTQSGANRSPADIPIGSAACAYSTSVAEFMAARVLIGLGGAGLIVIAFSVLTVLFSQQERPTTVGVMAGVTFVALPIGPILGGWLLSSYWWGWVFLINVPVVVVSLAAVIALVPESRASQRPGLDLVGVAVSAAGLVAVTYGLIQVGQDGWSDAMPARSSQAEMSTIVGKRDGGGHHERALRTGDGGIHGHGPGHRAAAGGGRVPGVRRRAEGSGRPGAGARRGRPRGRHPGHARCDGRGPDRRRGRDRDRPRRRCRPGRAGQQRGRRDLRPAGARPAGEHQAAVRGERHRAGRGHPGVPAAAAQDARSHRHDRLDRRPRRDAVR